MWCLTVLPHFSFLFKKRPLRVCGKHFCFRQASRMLQMVSAQSLLQEVVLYLVKKSFSRNKVKLFHQLINLIIESSSQQLKCYFK